MKTLGYVRACGKRWVWLSVPELWPNKILTLERKMFPRGMKNVETISVDADPASLYSTGVHYRANLEVLDVVSRRDSAPDDEGEGG